MENKESYSICRSSNLRLPTQGWIKPCFLCCQPTSRRTVYKYEEKHFHVHICSKCGKEMETHTLNSELIIFNDLKKIYNYLKNYSYSPYIQNEILLDEGIKHCNVYNEDWFSMTFIVRGQSPYDPQKHKQRNIFKTTKALFFELYSCLFENESFNLVLFLFDSTVVCLRSYTTNKCRNITSVSAWFHNHLNNPQVKKHFTFS